MIVVGMLIVGTMAKVRRAYFSARTEYSLRSALGACLTDSADQPKFS